MGKKNNLKSDNIENSIDQLRDIWQIHTDVQEQMVKLRSVPVSIISDSPKIVGEKLYLAADENDKTDKIIDAIAQVFQIDSSQISRVDGYLLCDKAISQNINKEIKKQLSEKASANFVNFQPQPIIDGFVTERKSPIENFKSILDKSNFDYRFDEKGRLQITLDDLTNLKNRSSDTKTNIEIPETASIILPIRPTPVFFLSKEYPEITFKHIVQVKKRKKDNLKEEYPIQWNRTIEVFNGYLHNNVLERWREKIGLTLGGYDYTFLINPDVAKKYNPKTSPYILPKYNTENNSFNFHVDLTHIHNFDSLSDAYNFEKLDFDLKYTRLKKFFDSYFGAENVRFEAKFMYTYDLYKFDTEFLPSQEYVKSDLMEIVYTSFCNENITISENTDSIGLDFNWQNDKIEDLLPTLFNKCPFVSFSYFKNHRCNIDFQIQNITLDEIENLLREKFPSIQTKRNDKNGILYFYQEYQTEEQRYRLRQILENEISSLNSKTFEVGLYTIPENKEKYILEIDVRSKKESLTATIKELRGSDFCVEQQGFGKLFRVNFPQMIFDISGDNFEKTKLLFESHTIASITPNLTGELEKIHRLKSSLNNILSGNNLQNRSLKDFIFDAQKAKKIDDVDCYIGPNSETFKDLEKHLLNTKINQPQKQAIIKTLLAEDLALIQGPPGTGKSTAIAEIIWQHIRRDPKERILLTSETNLAVDNAIDRIVNSNHNLVKPIRIGDEGKLEMEGRQFSVEVMKRWVENGNFEITNDEQNDDEESLAQKLILLNWIDNIKKRAERSANLNSYELKLWIEVLANPSSEIRKAFYENYIKNCNVIGATCSSIGQTNSQGKWTNFYWGFQDVFGKGKKLEFTTVIQDESSKATPAELSLPLVYGKKNIVIGDHRQLPPMLDKEEFKLSLDFLLDKAENKDERKKIQKLKTFVLKHFNEMEISHFERLFEKIDDSLKGIFNLQYRMHPDINEVIKQFYIQDGGLECGLITPVDLGVNEPDMSKSPSRYHGIEIDDLLSKDTHTIWIDTDSPELLDGTSRINYGEVEAIRDVLTKFRHSDSFKKYQSFWENPEDQQIGLISFYGKQIKLLQNLRNEFRDIPIRVSTVDRFQGMERNIIIVSMVRSNRIATEKKQKSDINVYGELGFPEQRDLGFAQSPNRLNVALSRAKRLLIIVGNSELFSQKEIYKNVYNTIANNPNSRIIKYEAQ